MRYFSISSSLSQWSPADSLSWQYSQSNTQYWWSIENLLSSKLVTDPPPQHTNHQLQCAICCQFDAIAATYIPSCSGHPGLCSSISFQEGIEINSHPLTGCQLGPLLCYLPKMLWSTAGARQANKVLSPLLFSLYRSP